MDDDVKTFFAALETEGQRVGWKDLTGRDKTLRKEYLVSFAGQTYSIWQTHKGEWCWSDPIQTQRDMNTPPKPERVIS